MINLKKKSQEKGITIIALVVTIVVMLFLAGITIIMAVGKDGISEKAMEAQIAQRRAEVHDDMKVIVSDWQIEKMIGQKTLKTYLKENFESVKDNGDGTYEVTLKGFKATINKDGDVVGYPEQVETEQG